MSTILFENATVLDPATGDMTPDSAVIVVDRLIREVGTTREVTAPNADRVIDVRGRTLMPGLIDAHVHVYFQSLDLPKLQSWPPSYLVPKAARALEDMLQRGFTTVRDTAGADFALAQAIDDGLIAGPRLIYGGPALSQTGGHGDGRRPGDDTEQSCCRCPHMSRIADGPDEVRKVSRDILRTGAAHLKLMLSGGVSTPTDSISSIQYTDEEIAVAVREASVQGKYVTGHAYLAEAIENALALGLRCIEHGNLLKPSTVASFVEHDAFLVPTLVTYKAMDEMGPAIGMSKSSHQKNSEVLATGLEALEMADRGGVKLVYGSDLIGELQTRQLEEFTIRSEVQSSIDVIRSATTTAAELTNLTGKVGVIAPDAHADLLVVDGDPITDISVLTRPDKYLDIVMRAGQIYRDAGK